MKCINFQEVREMRTHDWEQADRGGMGLTERDDNVSLPLSSQSDTFVGGHFNGYANDLTVFQLLLQDNIQVASESNLRRRENSFPDKFDGKNS